MSHIPNTARSPESSQRAAVTPQFLLAFGQTISELSTERVIGVELLARWRSSDGGVLLPADFLPMIEGLNLSAALDNRMIRTAAEFLRNAGSLIEFVSVNVGADHLVSGALVDSVQEIVETTSFNPTQLMLEVTEMSDHTSGPWNQNVERLQRLGVGVAIDDFGTGFSSMTRLIDAPINMVKVDRTLVERIDDTGCRALLRGVVEYATESDTSLVAEGVETRTQAKKIADLGIRYAQGFLFGPPAPLPSLRLDPLAERLLSPDESLVLTEPSLASAAVSTPARGNAASVHRGALTYQAAS